MKPYWVILSDGHLNEFYTSKDIACEFLGELLEQCDGSRYDLAPGARESTCPGCAWEYGTHSPDCGTAE